MANDPSVPDRKLYRSAQLDAIDKTTKALCHTIKPFSTRFSAAAFLELAKYGRE